MVRKNRHELQDSLDVERAARMLAHQHGLTDAQALHALGDRAAHLGISLHAAALAAVSTGHQGE
jgi:hypothetical protein